MEKNAIPQLVRAPHDDQVVSVHDDFTLEVCLTEESKQSAYQIRYHSYLEAGLIKENEKGVLSDEFDYLPNARIFLVWHQGKPVATVRSCIYSDAYNWLPIDGTQYFRQDVIEKTGLRTRLLESNRFAVDPDFQGRQSLFARLLLFRAHGLNAGVHQCEYITTCVQTNHIAFYQRFLGLEPISEQSQYYESLGVEISLLINKTEDCLATVLKRGMPAYDQKDILNYAMVAFIPQIDHQKNVA